MTPTGANISQHGVPETPLDGSKRLRHPSTQRNYAITKPQLCYNLWVTQLVLRTKVLALSLPMRVWDPTWAPGAPRLVLGLGVPAPLPAVSVGGGLSRVLGHSVVGGLGLATFYVSVWIVAVYLV